LVELENGELGTVEPYLHGEFIKHLNNSMTQSCPAAVTASDIAKKAFALAHFSLDHSNGNYLLTDIQG